MKSQIRCGLLTLVALTGLALKSDLRSAPVTTNQAQTVGRQVLGGHIPQDVKKLNLQPVDHELGSKRLQLAIGLPLRNQEALGALLQKIYDPASPDYRHYLTPEQFAEMFGPTEQDYEAVIAFAEANGFTVTATHPNRVVLDVEGTVADIEKTLHVTMWVYQHPKEARTFYAPDAEPSLDLAVPVLRIGGLDNYELPRPHNRIRPVNQSANATPDSGSGPSGTYRGNDFRAAYVPGTSLNGAGQNVGLLEFDGYYANDITTYISQSGISTSVVLTNVAVDGGIITPGSGDDEVSLDIELVIAMAPGVSNIYVYEAPNTTGLWEDMLGRMADDNLAKQLSCSWSGGSPNATAEQIFQQMALQGQSFFNATGDTDAFVTSIPFPSDSPNITEVGGTTLTTTGAGGSYVSETAWNWGKQDTSYVGSSGGISTYYSIPSYQQGTSMSANQGSTTMRNVPDVALTADNVWVAYGNGSSGTFGGTSCAAPLWAGFIALVNQQAAANAIPPVGFLNPTLYSIGNGANYTANFHDTTTGNNFSKKSPTKFSAVTAYDLCTGWGTPNGISLISALTAPMAPSITTEPVSQAVVVGNNVLFTAAAAGTAPITYHWQVSADGGSTWTDVPASSPYSGQATGTLTITGATMSMNGYQYRCVASNGVNPDATSNAATLTVNKATATVTLGSLSATYNGSPHSATATTSPTGLTVNFTYNSSSTAPTNAGSYAVVGTISDTNYQGSASGTLVIGKAAATVTLGSLSATYDGTAHSATATTSPTGLTVNFTYNSSSTAPTNAGSYAVVGTISDTNYQGSASGTLVIGKAAATVTLGSLSATYDGTAHSATATTSPTGLTVNFTYNSSSTAPTNAGSYAVVGTISDTNYQGSASGTLVIGKAAATVTLGSLSATYDGYGPQRHRDDVAHRAHGQLHLQWQLHRPDQRGKLRGRGHDQRHQLPGLGLRHAGDRQGDGDGDPGLPERDLRRLGPQRHGDDVAFRANGQLYLQQQLHRSHQRGKLRGRGHDQRHQLPGLGLRHPRDREGGFGGHLAGSSGDHLWHGAIGNAARCHGKRAGRFCLFAGGGNSAWRGRATPCT